MVVVIELLGRVATPYGRAFVPYGVCVDPTEAELPLLLEPMGHCLRHFFKTNTLSLSRQLAGAN